MAHLKIQNLNIVREHWQVIPSLSCDFPENKMVGILSPSHEDMSYFLKVIAGVYEPDNGIVSINDININHTTPDNLKKVRKLLTFVFQRGGLLANLSVIENILLPSDFHFPETDKETKLEKVHQLCELFEVHTRILKERPFKLQPQIIKLVALIRSFLLEPEIIIYDKPLLDLDLTRKKHVINYMIKLREQGKTTQIFSESSDVLFGLSDTNIVISQGQLIETGPWEELIASYDVSTQNIIREYLEIGLNETEI